MAMESEGLQLAKPKSRVLPFRDPDLGHKVDLHPEGAPPDEDFQIFISEKTLEQIRDYSGTLMDREVGGVMLGGYYVDDEESGTEGEGREFIVIDGFVEAKHGESKHASFKFTHDSWSHITRVMEDEYPESIIVGWHHTHPTFGIFLSSHDLFIQENFFNLHWQVALVVDPCRQTMGFLRLRERGARPLRCPFYVIRDKRK